MTTAKKSEEKHAPTKAEGKAPAAKKAPAPKKAAAPKKVTAPKAEATEVNVELSKGGSFIPAVGRRKSAIARVRLIKNGKGTITINGRKFDDYFNTYEQRGIVKGALETVGQADAVDISVKVQGGGLVGQAEAVRHGISRALLELNPTFRKSLKKLGYLTRDARKKERKKPGLKKARRAPQWSKR